VPLLLRFAPSVWFSESQRNTKLEGLRGLLAPSVLFHHAVITYYFYRNGTWESPPSHFYQKMGSGPVILFFFMTGYIFWNQLLKKKTHWSLKSFLIKRCRRLMPAYYVAFAVALDSVFIQSNYLISQNIDQLGVKIGSWVFFGLPFGKFSQINGFVNAVNVIAGVLTFVLVFLSNKFVEIRFLK
jgi:peptidoglycan/LPS O-acetylase OafA/YrhL